MASTPVLGDLVLIGPPTAASPVLDAGLYIVTGQSGANVTVVSQASAVGPLGAVVGTVIPLSRVLYRYANS